MIRKCISFLLFPILLDQQYPKKHVWSPKSRNPNTSLCCLLIPTRPFLTITGVLTRSLWKLIRNAEPSLTRTRDQTIAMYLLPEIIYIYTISILSSSRSTCRPSKINSSSSDTVIRDPIPSATFNVSQSLLPVGQDLSKSEWSISL